MTFKKLVPLVFSLFVCSLLNAQIEVAHLTSKGFSATGFGGFLNVGIPVTEAAAVTLEAGFYSFKQQDDHIAYVPFLLGYRHSLNGSGTGLYIEPTAGYSIGATDIQKADNAGSPVLGSDGKWLEQKAKGMTAGIGTGYIFPGSISFNIGIRYQRVFVSGDPSLNTFSLRISHAFSLGRRSED